MFYDRFVRLCKLKGVSPSNAAVSSGLSKSTVTRWKQNPDIVPSGAVLESLADYFKVPISELLEERVPLFNLSPIALDVSTYEPTHKIPILGRISAGLPLYAEEHVEGFTFTELNGGAEYFALRVHGDSMTAARINDGDLLIVRKQETVDNGQVAVVMVGDDEATVKRFYQEGDTVTLMPQSVNPDHRPQVYNAKKTRVRIIGLVVKIEITL